MSIYGREFTLKLNASGLQHIVTGNTEYLTVALVKKEFGNDQQNIYCTLYDGTYFYNFGEKLDSAQQSQLVAAIANFIDEHRL